MIACARTNTVRERVRNVAAPFTCAPMRKAAMRTEFVATAATSTTHARPLRNLRQKWEFHSMSNLNFDSHQFAGRRHAPVQAEYTLDGWTHTGIAYEDFRTMHTQPSSVSLRDRRWIPAFAASNEKLRRVLLHKAWSYIDNSHTAPLAALAYRAWRFREDSVTIAEALHTTPQAVRVNLQRLCDVARKLGFETFERHSSFQRPLVPRRTT